MTGMPCEFRGSSSSNPSTLGIITSTNAKSALPPSSSQSITCCPSYFATVSYPISPRFMQSILFIASSSSAIIILRIISPLSLIISCNGNVWCKRVVKGSVCFPFWVPIHGFNTCHPGIQLSSSDEPHLQSISDCTLGSRTGISEVRYLHILWHLIVPYRQGMAFT